MAQPNEESISELSEVIRTWAESYGLRVNIETNFSPRKILVVMSVKPQVTDEERKIVD